MKEKIAATPGLTEQLKFKTHFIRLTLPRKVEVNYKKVNTNFVMRDYMFKPSRNRAQGFRIFNNIESRLVS